MCVRVCRCLWVCIGVKLLICRLPFHHAVCLFECLVVCCGCWCCCCCWCCCRCCSCCCCCCCCPCDVACVYHIGNLLVLVILDGACQLAHARTLRVLIPQQMTLQRAEPRHHYPQPNFVMPPPVGRRVA